MHELVLKNDVIDRVSISNLEEARLFFIKRKQMTEEQFDELGYTVREHIPK